MEHTQKGLTAWQLTVLAIGTMVGGSFFLGSAVAIHSAGPAVVLSYIIGGILVYFILFALSEMTVADPAPGSFRTFAEKEFGRGAGFVVGWVYWTGLVLAMSSEATAISILLRSWFPEISVPLIGALIIIGISLVNLLGADRLSKLESGLAFIKLLAMAGFIILGILLIVGFIKGSPAVGAGELVRESWFPGGVAGIAGSMLLVILTYAGFEIIGLAASEADNPQQTVPKAIKYTVFGIAGAYLAVILVLLPLVPTGLLSEEQSPLALALSRWGLVWTRDIMNMVLVSAILSTLLASMFGLGRMIRSLADEGHAPSFLKDRRNVPYRGILFSGAAMLGGVGLGSILPQQIYIFLISSGGFALLFSYLAIMVTHYKFRQRHGCPAKGKCQLPGYPYSSWIVLISLVAIIASMPLVKGQGLGLMAGLAMLVIFILIHVVKSRFFTGQATGERKIHRLSHLEPEASVEVSEELIPKELDPEELVSEDSDDQPKK